LEKQTLVDQRRGRVRAFIEAHQEQLARQGSVVCSYRWRDGRKVGPYYRLAYREGTQQRSLYLGNDMELVTEIRGTLQALQQPKQQQRAVRCHKAAIRSELAKCREGLRRELAIRGLRLQGHEVRGWRSPGRCPSSTNKALSNSNEELPGDKRDKKLPTTKGVEHEQHRA